MIVEFVVLFTAICCVAAFAHKFGYEEGRRAGHTEGSVKANKEQKKRMPTMCRCDNGRCGHEATGSDGFCSVCRDEDNCLVFWHLQKPAAKA